MKILLFNLIFIFCITPLFLSGQDAEDIYLDIANNGYSSQKVEKYMKLLLEESYSNKKISTYKKNEIINRLSRHFPVYNKSLGGYDFEQARKEIEKLKKEYIILDAEKAHKIFAQDAEKIYPLYKKGDKVTVVYKSAGSMRTVTGEFYCLKGNLLYVSLYVIDIRTVDKKMLSCFSPEENKRKRDLYIRKCLAAREKSKEAVLDSYLISHPAVAEKAGIMIYQGKLIAPQDFISAKIDEHNQIIHKKEIARRKREMEARKKYNFMNTKTIFYNGGRSTTVRLCPSCGGSAGIRVNTINGPKFIPCNTCGGTGRR